MRDGKDLSDPRETNRRMRGIRQVLPTIIVDTFSASRRGSSSYSDPASAVRHGRSVSGERTPLLSGYRDSSPASKRHDRPPDDQGLLTVPGHSPLSYGGATLYPTPPASDNGSVYRHSGDIASWSGDESVRYGAEQSIQVKDNPFEFTPEVLLEMLDAKSLPALWALGGLQGLVRGLRTDSCSGLSDDETAIDEIAGLHQAAIDLGPTFTYMGRSSLRGLLARSLLPRSTTAQHFGDRKRVFGTNHLPEKKSKSLLQIMWITFNDKVLIILTVVAMISLVLGLYQDFGQPRRDDGGPKVRWVEGATIMVAVAIVVIVGSINDYQRELQFVKLAKKVRVFFHLPVALTDGV